MFGWKCRVIHQMTIVLGILLKKIVISHLVTAHVIVYNYYVFNKDRSSAALCKLHYRFSIFYRTDINIGNYITHLFLPFH